MPATEISTHRVSPGLAHAAASTRTEAEARAAIAAKIERGIEAWRGSLGLTAPTGTPTP